ncbi:MAG TPA: hypothetical protein VN280_06185 [Variovorax sp.]|nr:hypothetical protein [Variovorax sp.]
MTKNAFAERYDVTMDFSDLLMQVARAESKRSAALCSRLADQFEDDLLEYADFPDEHLMLFMTLLSDRRYFERPGIWNFVLAVNNARDALTKEQLERIGEAFVANFQNYLDPDLCLAVCDFVARNIQPSRAAELLKELKLREAVKPSDVQGIVDQGFFILSQEVKRAAQRAGG